ncbi:MAG: MBL fold metallo-hydrolase [Balneolaceae bacterium]|nr:MBL fold metallo-hydrolase [Balneolaceae bacterium]
MDRRQFLIRSSMATAATFLPFQKLLANNAGTFTDLRDNVGIFTDRGGTIGWLAADDAILVVDSQYPQTAKGCLNGLQDMTDHAMDVLINTHHHGDHTGGNSIFQPVAKTMVAHENVPGLMKKSFEEGDSDTEPAYPSTTYQETWEADLGSETVHARYYGNAHTGGDSVIYFENANVVHMGDLVFNRMNPYTDRPSGASVHNWINVLATVEEEYPADAIYIFGHGKPDFGVTGDKSDVAVMRDYLSAMVEHVEQGVESGKSKEEIIDLEELQGFEEFQYADWWTLSQNLDVVYQEVMER